VLAESAERLAVESRKKYLTDAVGDRRDTAIKSTWLALALARGGKLAEAAPACSTERRPRCATRMTCDCGARGFARPSSHGNPEA
jgi:hypothetical protein